jgi:hypothetical protein
LLGLASHADVPLVRQIASSFVSSSSDDDD